MKAAARLTAPIVAGRRLDAGQDARRGYASDLQRRRIHGFERFQRHLVVPARQERGQVARPAGQQQGRVVDRQAGGLGRPGDQGRRPAQRVGQGYGGLDDPGLGGLGPSGLRGLAHKLQSRPNDA